MSAFTIYPALDLRHGQIVRLQYGDPNRQTGYDLTPAQAALRWVAAGARWLHVVNLDGAFEQADQANRRALESILAVKPPTVRLQFGGGIRTFQAVQAALDLGVSRVILGTAVVQSPEVLAQALAAYGPERVMVSLDAQEGRVRVRGWQEDSALDAVQLAGSLAAQGLQRLVFTDVGRDGVGTGLNLPATVALAQASGLQVIASGGVRSQADLDAARLAGLEGAIVGRALYEGWLSIDRWHYEEGASC